MEIPLLMLHGALATQRQFDSLISTLNSSREPYCITFEGHGEYGPIDRPYRIESFADNVIHYLDQKGIEKADLFGYSMGGYVALYLARQAPGRVRRLATLATVLSWDEETAEREADFLDPKKIEEKVPDFSRKLDQRHSFGWKEVVTKTKEMILHLGRNPVLSDDDWSAIQHPVRLHVGDRDSSAGPEQTLRIYRRFKNGELSVLPDTSHSIDQTEMKLLTPSVKDFFDL